MTKKRLLVYKFAQLRAVARRRGLTVAITFKQYKNFIRKGLCHYCDGPLPPRGIGIDRKDNTKAYVPRNCVPCCRSCNSAKSQKTYREFMWLKKGVHAW